jgi:prepilin-type processing-associated H-X9-DG protein
VANIIPVPDWFSFIQTAEPRWYTIGGYDEYSTAYWPNGWGGPITDSWTQGRAVTYSDIAAVPNGFYLSIAVNGGWVGDPTTDNRDRRTTTVNNVAEYVICGDMNPYGLDDIMTLVNTAYADLVNYCDSSGDPECACTEPDDAIGPGGMQYWTPEMWRTVAARKPYARHLGGTNLGFLDGHAAWWDAERLLSKVSEGKGAPGTTMGLYAGSEWGEDCVTSWFGTPWALY